VFDIASVKSPMLPALRRGVEGGLLLCSIHPMFGPETFSIIDRNVVVCNCGSIEAVDQARSLVDGANIVEMDVEEHDPVMAYVLGLGHAVNIAFFESLRSSGKSYDELNQAASTTFQRQAETARGVAGENAQLYYEIQNLNPHNAEALEFLQKAFGEVRRAGETGDREAFERMMLEGRDYFGGSE